MAPARLEGDSRLGGERGFSLPEILVAIAILLVVLTAGYGLLRTTVSGEPRVSDRAASIQEARTLMERVSRELRQGYGIDSAQPSQLVILTYVKRTECGGSPASSSIPCRVTYSCSAGACSRTERNPDGGGGGAAVQLVEGLADSNVFAYLPSPSQPSYVGLTLSFPATGGDDAITLDDGAALRNAGGAG